MSDSKNNKIQGAPIEGADRWLYNRSAEPVERKDRRVVPPSFRLAGAAINLWSMFSTEQAARRLSSLWFRVFKKPLKPWVAEFWADADQSYQLEIAGRELVVSAWGQGPLVVMMHGWSGSGTQFRNFIPALVDAGYQVAVFDAPAHGQNSGRQTHVMAFVDTLIAIQQKFESIDTLIAHSLGGMAATLAMRRGLQVRRLVLLAPHLDGEMLLDTYAQLLKLRPGLIQRFRELVRERMDRLLQAEDSHQLLKLEALLDGEHTDGMLVFDQADSEIPIEHFEEIARLWVSAKTIRTHGLGHHRLLKDKQVIGQVIDYLRETEC